MMPEHTEIIVNLLLSTAAGMAIGCMHFYALRWNTRLFLGDSSIRITLALQILRWSAMIGVLYLCARIHLSLLMIALGILIGRQCILHQARRP